MPHHAIPSRRENVAIALLAGVLASCGPIDRAGAPAAERQDAQPAALSVFRGDFERRLALSGEIDAVAAVELKGPRVPTGKSPLRFLASEGAEVKAGDVVAELDSSSFVAEIKDRSLQLSQAEIDLQRQISLNGVSEADRTLDVERKRAAVERAVLDADVPEGILPNRDYLDKQLILRRARVDLEKSQEALALGRRTADSDLEVKRIAIEKLRRAMSDAEHAIGSLTLRSTEAGTVIVADHPEERRKLQEGDDVFMGMTVARVASSRARRVRAVLIDVDDGKIAVGMPARVVLDAHPEQSFAGVVKDIAPVARTPGDTRGAQRRIFAVNVDLNDAEAAVLRPGLSARVEVSLQRQTQVLLAPRTAIDWSAAQTRARLPGRKFAPVTVGECNREVCVIETGLIEGTRLAGGRS
jgi:HlyD family secretion protein